MKEVLPISIVIPAKNEEKNIRRLLTGIYSQTHLPMEVIIADAGSEDNSAEVYKEFDVKVIEGGMPSVGRNNGMKESSEEIIFFIDADVELLDEVTLVDIYDDFVGKKLDCGAPLFKSKNNSKKNRRDVFLANLAKVASTKTPLLVADWSTFIVLRKKTLEEVGGFNENIEYMEDTLLVKDIVRKRGKYDMIRKKVGVDIMNDSKRELGQEGLNLRTFAGLILGVVSLFLLRFKWTRNLAYRLNKVAKKFYGPLGGIVKFDNPYKPEDRDSGYPVGVRRGARRFFEWIPGFITWTLLLLPVIFAVLRWERLFVIYIAYLVAYWTVRTFKFVYGITEGSRRMQRDVNTDWMSKIKEENPEGFDKLKFIYLCPVYAESMDTLGPSFEMFSKNDIGAGKIDVVMAMEEAKSEMQIENFKKLKTIYGDKFGSMQYYVHPKGIPGEVAGVKGANINWALRHYVEKLENEGKDLHDYLLVTCDSDLRPHHKYLSAIAYKYLTVEDPDMKFFATAVHTFNNNIWKVPSLIRAQSSMLSLVLMQNWVIDKKKRIPFAGEEIYVRDSFSSYVVNLKTVHDFEYWNPEIANDDTAFYWNAMIRSQGKFKSEEVYVPTYNDAVENETYLKSHISFYKQQHRWGWGVINVPISLAAMFKDSTFPWSKRLFLMRMIFESQIWYLTIVFIMTFGLNIMSWINPDFQFSAYAYNLPQILSYVFTLLAISNIPMVIYRRKMTPVPQDWKWWRHILDFGETVLTTINMLTFSFLPFLQAQTEMMFGKANKMRNFYVTEKVAIKKEES